MKVELKGQVYEFSFNTVWGALYTYEDFVGEKLPFDPKRTLCLHILFYCILVRVNEGFNLTFDEFVECLNDLKLATSMKEYYFKRMEVLSQGVEEEPLDDKKKV